ncbi:MAG: hypothetical protein U1E29_10605 [Coriobacteriia bacterium]|nr:hypothetical protein [Coriobacteriia bacterium]
MSVFEPVLEAGVGFIAGILSGAFGVGGGIVTTRYSALAWLSRIDRGWNPAARHNPHRRRGCTVVLA